MTSPKSKSKSLRPSPSPSTASSKPTIIDTTISNIDPRYMQEIGSPRRNGSRNGKNTDTNETALPKETKSEREQKELAAYEHQEMLKARLDDVSERSHLFAKEIERLKTDSKKKESDTTDMVKYLEAEVRRKDITNKKLMKSAKDAELEWATERAALIKQYEAQLKYNESVFMAKEEQLLEKNKALMQEVSDLSLFRSMRAELAAELEATKETIYKNERRHKLQLDDLERKFLAARDRLQAEAMERIAYSRKTYKDEVGKELDLESKQVRLENIEMAAELKFHEATSDRLQKENANLQQTVKTLRMELSLRKQQDEEYAKRGLKQQKRIEELSNKSKTLERSLTQVLHDIEIERTTLKESHTRDTQHDKDDVNALRHALRLKNKELATIKRHAHNILQQRNEIETFFLEAIEQTRNEIRAKRELEYKEAKALHSAQLRALALPRGTKFPAIRAPDARLPEPTPPSQHVDLADLTLADREKVLRLLFAKINNQTSTVSMMMPTHSFDVEERQERLLGNGLWNSDSTPALHAPDYTPDPHDKRPASNPVISSYDRRGLTFLTDIKVEDESESNT